MAGASLFTLLDDIATVLDDVAVMTKVAAKKTAGVLGDDLALNAQQVTGVKPDRELPVVWAVAKGSTLNKLILVPAALAISALAPWAVMPLLMLGGAFLCYEGFEKLAHKVMHSEAEDQAHHIEHLSKLKNEAIDIAAAEKGKIKGAVRTDFILSAEIIAITLGTVAGAPFLTQLAVLVSIASIMTVGVYGFVAAIVKLDDAGLYLSTKTGVARSVGRGILLTAPYMMKTLSVLGMAAMFMVGGGILAHGIPAAEETVHHLAVSASAALPTFGHAVETFVAILADGLIGIVAGALVLGLVLLAGKLVTPFRQRS